MVRRSQLIKDDCYSHIGGLFTSVLFVPLLFSRTFGPFALRIFFSTVFFSLIPPTKEEISLLFRLFFYYFLSGLNFLANFVTFTTAPGAFLPGDANYRTACLIHFKEQVSFSDTFQSDTLGNSGTNLVLFELVEEFPQIVLRKEVSIRIVVKLFWLRHN